MTKLRNDLLKNKNKFSCTVIEAFTRPPQFNITAKVTDQVAHEIFLDVYFMLSSFGDMIVEDIFIF